MDYTQIFENVSSSVRFGHDEAPKTGMPRGWLVARRAWIRDHDATTYGGASAKAGTMTG